MEFSAESQALERHFAHWADGVRSELRHWRKSLGQAVKQQLAWYVEMTRPNRPVYSAIAQFLPTSGPVRVLDVGAGPLSVCGDRLGDRTVELVPIDPLAYFYRQICSEVGAKPPVPTRFGFAEDISTRFAPDTFDAALSVNALDHSIDPVQALIEMLIVTKIGGVLFLDHHRNESEKHSGSGLHQWNFDLEGGDFVISSPDGRVNITRQFKAFADVKSWMHSECVHVLVTKHASPVGDFAEFHRTHRRVYLEAFLGYIASHELPPPFGMPSVRRRALKTLVRFR